MSRFTSAIPGMSVTDMRRSLSEVRNLLADQNLKNPFNFQHTLSNDIVVWKFVHQVALGLHQKRTHNRRKVGTRVDDTDEE